MKFKGSKVLSPYYLKINAYLPVNPINQHHLLVNNVWNVLYSVLRAVKKEEAISLCLKQLILLLEVSSEEVTLHVFDRNMSICK